MLTILLTQFAATSCTRDFFGLKPWYYYLNLDGKCDVKNFQLFPDGDKAGSIPPIMLAIIDDLLRLAGIIAIAYVIVGAIGYITSQGNPEDSAKAQSTIINALIGVAVTTVAVAFVGFIGARLGN